MRRKSPDALSDRLISRLVMIISKNYHDKCLRKINKVEYISVLIEREEGEGIEHLHLGKQRQTLLVTCEGIEGFNPSSLAK